MPSIAIFIILPELFLSEQPSLSESIDVFKHIGTGLPPNLRVVLVRADDDSREYIDFSVRK